MKTVTTEYQNAIVAPVSTDILQGHIDMEPFNISDLVSVKISKKATSGSDLQIGGVFAEEMQMELFWEESDGDYKRYNGSGIRLLYGIKTSDMEDYETVPLNKFEVVKTERKSQTIVLTAYDYMLRLEQEFDGADEISHPLYWWYTYICDACQVTVGMTEADFNALPNITTVGAITIKAGGVFSTCRDVAHHIAVLIGGYAYIDGTSLKFDYYRSKNAVMTIPINLTDDGDKFSDYMVNYTTVTAKHGDTLITATTGEDGRTYKLGELPLLESFSGDGVYQTVVTNILNNLSTISYVPFELKWTGNPALECTDFVSIEDTDIVSPLMLIDWEFDGMETLKAVGTENATVQIASSSSGSQTSKEIQQAKININADLQNYATKEDLAQVGSLKNISDGQTNGTVVLKDATNITDSQAAYALNLGYKGNCRSAFSAIIGGSQTSTYHSQRSCLLCAESASISGDRANFIIGGIGGTISGSATKYCGIVNTNGGTLSADFICNTNMIVNSSSGCAITGSGSGGVSYSMIINGQNSKITSTTWGEKFFCLIVGPGNTISNKRWCILIGMGLVGGSDNQIIIGMYNADTTAAFAVGNGSSISNRSNAFEVFADGKVNVQTDILIDNVSIPKSYTINLAAQNATETDDLITENVDVLSQYRKGVDSLQAVIASSNYIPLSVCNGNNYVFTFYDVDNDKWRTYKIVLNGDTYTKTYTEH